MIKIIRPIIFAFLTSNAVKQLVIDLLAAYAKKQITALMMLQLNLSVRTCLNEEKSIRGDV